MFSPYGRGMRVRVPRTSRRSLLEPLEQRITMSGAPPKVVEVAVSSTDWSPAYIAFINSGPNPIGGYSIPDGSSAQTAALPWKNIDQIKIRFDKDVHVQAADLALTGKNIASYAFEEFFYDPVSQIATWTLASPIGKDRLMLDLDANGIDPVSDLEGNVLDGEWVNNADTFTSGNNTAGGDFEFLFNVLPGEVNSTTQVNSLDYVLSRNQEGKTTTSAGYNLRCDIDGSGTIEVTDWQFVQSKLGNALPSGNPTGVGNDAPTYLAIPGKSLNPGTSQSVPLWSHFADAENGVSGLTYGIASISLPSLFSSVSIDQSTGQLNISAASGVSGRSKINVIATDSSGISVMSSIPADVGFSNQPPVIADVVPSYWDAYTWRYTGVVYDDDDVTGLIVSFEGAFNKRVAVYPDGSFEFFIYVGDIPYELEYAETSDWYGMPSNLYLVPIGLG